jgi:hypothetical protein
MIDVIKQIGAVQRTVDGQTVTVSQVYPTDLEDLWEAITTPERIARWLMPVTGDLKLGGRYQLQGNAGGTIVACDPPSSSTRCRTTTTGSSSGRARWAWAGTCR